MSAFTIKPLLGAFLFSILTLIFLACQYTKAEDKSKADSMLDMLERKLELSRHEQLVRQKQDARNKLSEFTTDGCSGGLSVGWQYLSDNMDRLKHIHGDLPPWESCCITHDNRYHQAGPPDITAEMSFDARKDADEQLRDCVLEVGVSRAPKLSIEYDLSTDEVEHIYKIIGNLMYRAVRIGGVPCTGLPWRWGYGWPQCD